LKKIKGFTLVEALVVIGILALIGTFAAPAIFANRRGEQAKTCMSNLREIDNAKSIWCVDHLNNRTISSQGEAVTPTWKDILPYSQKLAGKEPVCPLGGQYSLNDIYTSPTCSIGTTARPSTAEWATTGYDHVLK